MLDRVASTQHEKRRPDPVDIHVGARIRLRRSMLGISQEKLGAGLGVTFQQVQKYEKGSNRVGASRMQQISNILDVPVSFFFEDAPGSDANSHQTSELASFISSAEGLRVNRAFASIKDPAARRKLAALITTVAGLETAA